jgi:Rab11 family-interacting protein 3/4
MYSDVSLEDVQDLNHKLEMLQQQVTSLADNSENKHARAKTETAVLQAKYHMLEEQLRETELRYEERLVDEQKRHRELLSRVERDAELKLENAQIRIQTLEAEQSSLRDEIQRTRSQSDKQLAEIRLSEEKLESARFNLSIAQENLSEARAHEKRYMMEKSQSDQMVIELHKEVERIRNETQAMMASAVKRSNFHNISASSLSLESNASSEPFKVDDMMNEIEDLKQQNRHLQESNEELQAMLLNKNIEEGRNLLNGGTSTVNLADELKEMGQTQVRFDINFVMLV